MGNACSGGRDTEQAHQKGQVGCDRQGRQKKNGRRRSSKFHEKASKGVPARVRVCVEGFQCEVVKGVLSVRASSQQKPKVNGVPGAWMATWRLVHCFKNLSSPHTEIWQPLGSESPIFPCPEPVVTSDLLLCLNEFADSRCFIEVHLHDSCPLAYVMQLKGHPHCASWLCSKKSLHQSFVPFDG